MPAYKIHFIIGALSTLFITLALGLLIFIRGRGGKTVRSYFFFMITISSWALCLYMMVAVKTLKDVLIWGKITHIPASFIPILYFHFGTKLINVKNQLKSKIFIGYILSVVFAVLNFTPYFLKSSSNKLGFMFVDPGYLYPLFIIFFFSLPAYAHYLMFNIYADASRIAKRQVKYYKQRI
jgi:hypothetical protein